MRKFCCVLLAMLPLSALAAYPIEVNKKIDGVSIDYSADDTDSDIASIRLNNYGTTDATCKVVFRNGPESPRARSVTVPAGKTTNTTAKFNRSILKMRIDLNCTPK